MYGKLGLDNKQCSRKCA